VHYFPIFRHAILIRHRPLALPEAHATEASAMNERARLLALLMDEEVITILKQRLTAEERADLVLEIINPHRPLSPEQQATLAGVSVRALRYRKCAKPRS
jgi:hypothetical protein